MRKILESIALWIYFIGMHSFLRLRGWKVVRTEHGLRYTKTRQTETGSVSYYLFSRGAMDKELK